MHMCIKALSENIVFCVILTYMYKQLPNRFWLKHFLIPYNTPKDWKWASFLLLNTHSFAHIIFAKAPQPRLHFNTQSIHLCVD